MSDADDARRERVAEALFNHLVGTSRGCNGYTWPAPEQHLPWWYAAADAAIAAYETRPIPPGEGGTNE